MQELNMRDSLDANLVQMSTNYCLVYVAFSAALFYRLSTHFLPLYIPLPVVKENKQWMFKNICNSFLHSSISSVWIAFCLWNYPAHRHDLINVYSNQCYLLICFSVGYFLYDFLDMYWNDWEDSLHLLAHHVVVIAVFGVALYSRFYLGYAMVGLLVEVNSVFLHIRTLMRLTACTQTSPRIYGAVCVLNFGTFIVFRIYLLAYLTHWLISHRPLLHPNLFLFTLPCLATINVMSWLLFVKITVEDFATVLIRVGRLLGRDEWVRSLEEQIARAAMVNNDVGEPNKNGGLLKQDLSQAAHCSGQGARVRGGKVSDKHSSPLRRRKNSKDLRENIGASILSNIGEASETGISLTKDFDGKESQSYLDSDRVGEAAEVKEERDSGLTEREKDGDWCMEERVCEEELGNIKDCLVSTHSSTNFAENDRSLSDFKSEDSANLAQEFGLTSRPDSTLLHRLSCGESPTKVEPSSCSNYVETEGERKVNQAKVKTS